jgi:hypothetical protein
MAQRRLYEYKEDDLTRLLDSWLSGIIEPGRYRGFDFLPTANMTLTLGHDQTGFQSSQFTNPVVIGPKLGICMTRQGVVVQEDDIVTVPVNTTGSQPRVDLVVLTHEYVTAPGGAAAVYSVVQGTAGPNPLPPGLPQPEKQIVVGQLFLPAGTTALNQPGVVWSPTPPPALANLGNIAYLDVEQVFSVAQSFSAINFRINPSLVSLVEIATQGRQAQLPPNFTYHAITDQAGQTEPNFTGFQLSETIPTGHFRILVTAYVGNSSLRLTFNQFTGNNNCRIVENPQTNQLRPGDQMIWLVVQDSPNQYTAQLLSVVSSGNARTDRQQAFTRLQSFGLASATLINTSGDRYRVTLGSVNDLPANTYVVPVSSLASGSRSKLTFIQSAPEGTQITLLFDAGSQWGRGGVLPALSLTNEYRWVLWQDLFATPPANHSPIRLPYQGMSWVAANGSVTLVHRAGAWQVIAHAGELGSEELSIPLLNGHVAIPGYPNSIKRLDGNRVRLRVAVNWQAVSTYVVFTFPTLWVPSVNHIVPAAVDDDGEFFANCAQIQLTSAGPAQVAYAGNNLINYPTWRGFVLSEFVFDHLPQTD